MSNKVLIICLIVFGLFLVLSPKVIFAQGLCDPCDDTCDAGYECVGDPNPGDGNPEGKCQMECPSGQVCIRNPLRACSFEDLVEDIIDFIFYIALGLVPLMVLIGAFYLMTAGGDTKRVKTGKNAILYAAIGLLIIMFAKGFIAVLKHIFGTQ